MINPIVRIVVPILFKCTSRVRATASISKQLTAYMALAEKLTPEEGMKSVHVPGMPGVDEDMRDWSFYMLLEHNVIVNRMFRLVVHRLVLDKDLSSMDKVDPKRDVMPSAAPGPEQVEAFRKSVEDYLEIVSKLPSLRGTSTRTHPLFGEFDAHSWHCMFGFHLNIHYKQAAFITRNASSDKC